MTFNQFCAGYRFTPHSRISLEAVWNALIEGGCEPPQCKHLLEELLEDFRERGQ